MQSSLPPYQSRSESAIAQLEPAQPARAGSTYAPPPASGFGDPPGIPWSRYVDVLRRNLLLIGAITVTGIVAAVFITRRVRAVYEAQATIWISASNSQQQSGPIRPEQLLPSGSYIDLLRSFAIIEPVVQRLNLNVSFRDPADSALFRHFSAAQPSRPGSYVLRTDASGSSYTLATSDDVVVERGAANDSIGRRIGLAWQPTAQALGANRRVIFTVLPVHTAAVGLRNSLRASLPENGQFLTLAMAGSDSRRTADIVNAWADQFVTSATELKKRHIVEFRRTLEDQLGLAESELHRSESELEQFRVNTITLPSVGAPIAGGVQATRDPVLTNYFQEKESLDQVRSDRQALERMFAESVGGRLNTQAFLLLPSILNNTPQLRAAIEELSARQAALRTEKQYLTDANPRVKQLAEAVRTLEEETIPEIARSALTSLRAREADMMSRVDTQSAQLRSIPARTIEEMRLLRQVAAAENLYNTLKARYEQVSLFEAETTPDLSVLDSAVAPMHPTSNEAPRLLLLAGLASLGAALGIALLRDKLDPRFRYPEQARSELRLAITGTVPRFKAARNGRIDVTSMSRAVESFRSLRLALRYAFPQGAPMVFSVSSPGAGDGKSLVSSNLALAFASAGQRTLLIDGDVRCGTQHSTFDVPLVPGLVDYLQSGADMQEIVKATGTENLHMLPCGTRKFRAPELLLSDRMLELINDMRRRYDVIIIDSPPFVAGVDAYALGAVTGSMLVVLRPGVTDRKLAAAKLDVLDNLPVRVLGSVLNSVSDDGAYRYYGYEYDYNGVVPTTPGGNVATPKGLVISA